ncbi:LOW QUALITY PROTEIN: uncharacterized protein LOC115290616 [Suricata suricatta]|uniref:LOW QUALITY PROTEIN: uncharacterized protein LOC115290616 n=1 Tax=Suricata suricatta TaxID=37032 RepID=UPI001155F0AB|nr:LOW QUALITY PROTEIN: uncharacterized protein LOC115290616 [Suricata suricatta]
MGPRQEVAETTSVGHQGARQTRHEHSGLWVPRDVLDPLDQGNLSSLFLGPGDPESRREDPEAKTRTKANFNVTLGPHLSSFIRRGRRETHLSSSQLLQVLFTTEERERILVETRKLVPGPTGVPTINPPDIDAGFPLVCPSWDYNTGEGREQLKVYRQALLAGLKAATRRPTNLTRVYDLRQETNKSPAAFLERVIEAFRQFTLYDPELTDHNSTVATPDIKKKLQKVEHLGKKTLQDLLKITEKVYNNRDNAEKKTNKD